MATIRTCDRCGGQGEVEAAFVSTEGLRSNYPHKRVWSGDLCQRCRLALERWLKPLPEGPQKRKGEA